MPPELKLEEVNVQSTECLCGQMFGPSETDQWDAHALICPDYLAMAREEGQMVDESPDTGVLAPEKSEVLSSEEEPKEEKKRIGRPPRRKVTVALDAAHLLQKMDAAIDHVEDELKEFIQVVDKARGLYEDDQKQLDENRKLASDIWSRYQAIKTQQETLLRIEASPDYQAGLLNDEDDFYTPAERRRLPKIIKVLSEVLVDIAMDPVFAISEQAHAEEMIIQVTIRENRLADLQNQCDVLNAEQDIILDGWQNTNATQIEKIRVGDIRVRSRRFNTDMIAYKDLWISAIRKDGKELSRRDRVIHQLGNYWGVQFFLDIAHYSVDNEKAKLIKKNGQDMNRAALQFVEKVLVELGKAGYQYAQTKDNEDKSTVIDFDAYLKRMVIDFDFDDYEVIEFKTERQRSVESESLGAAAGHTAASLKKALGLK